MTGGIGRTKLSNFYLHHFIFNNPDDTSLELISRTVGIDRVVDEFIFSFTHDKEVDWLYVSPLNKLPHVKQSTCVVADRNMTESPASPQPASRSASPSHLSSTFAATDSTTSTSHGIKRPFSFSWVSCHSGCLFRTNYRTGGHPRQGRDLNTRCLLEA